MDHESYSLAVRPHCDNHTRMQNEGPTDFEAMLAGMLSRDPNDLGVDAARENNKAILDSIKDFDSLRLASTFGGMLTVPDLQSNCVRLESLVHVSLAEGRGARKPNTKTVSRMFSKLGDDIAGWKEDPAEDVFVSLVSTSRGNFRVLEGIWEGAGFYLQRVVNTLEAFPQGGRYGHMREAVFALLKLSDAVCERARLQAHLLGNDIPLDDLPAKLLDSLHALRRRVVFSASDLEALGIVEAHLAEFGFDPARRFQLAKEKLSHSLLERYPLIYRDAKLHFVLPTATSAAIRRYIVENVDDMGVRDAFVGMLSQEYARLFSDTPLLGGQSGAQLEFRATSHGLTAGVMTAIDQGRFLNLVFSMDTLAGFEASSFAGANEARGLAEDSNAWVQHAYEQASKTPGFKGGLTLCVACGVGRGLVGIAPKERPDWRVEFISASDLFTLSWLPKFKPLTLWRLLDSESKLRTLGVELQNINGLLNLVAWCRNLDGHLVPHADVPEEFGTDDRVGLLMVDQNALRTARHEVATYWDAHRVQDVSGAWVNVRKIGESFFAEDLQRPYYVTEERPDSRWPRGLYEARNRAWWHELETPNGASGAMAYERSKLLQTWLCRAAPILDAALDTLPAGPVLWRCRFEGNLGDIRGRPPEKRPTYDMARAAISVHADIAASTVTLTVAPEFEDALAHPENIAERALIDSLLEGFEHLAEITLPREQHCRLLQEIVPDTSARQTHRFQARTFRDYVRTAKSRSPRMIDADDGAYIKLGLGWQARRREEGGEIRGKPDCMAFLNATVRLLEDELCHELGKFDRRSVVLFALRNHESAAMDRDVWRRTAAAVLALHDDKEAALQTIAEHGGKLNAVFQASRLLVEVALCECPLSGGEKPGHLDLLRIESKLLLAAGYGGWSDAIRWDAIEPEVRVRPLGDIHANVSFSTDILAPYGRVGSDLRVDEDVRSYAEHFEEPEARPTDGSAWPDEFWDAFQETFGATFDEVRTFVDYVEDVGLEVGSPVFEVKKNRLLDVRLGKKTLAADVACRLVDFLLFRSRPSWRVVRAGYEGKDRFLWRYRRALSILRKPLIQLDDAEDPTVIVAPGVLRDAFAYMLGNYHRGDFPLRQLTPKMRKWAGKSRDRIGHDFNAKVAAQLQELGWQTDTEVKPSKILRKGLEKDYGDVDVLAWNEEASRVLVIECKDVQYRKTEGEIAEQLADFRGELNADGKPDHLLRHLNRFDLLSQHSAEVAKSLGLRGAAKIESHLIFRNPVPMQFALTRMAERVTVNLFADLADI